MKQRKRENTTSIIFFSFKIYMLMWSFCMHMPIISHHSFILYFVYFNFSLNRCYFELVFISFSPLTRSNVINDIKVKYTWYTFSLCRNIYIRIGILAGKELQCAHSVAATRFLPIITWQISREIRVHIFFFFFKMRPDVFLTRFIFLTFVSCLVLASFQTVFLSHICPLLL